ncbi:MAG: DUF2271 domain-containing protein, partial [Opitutaceae bacterium]
MKKISLHTSTRWLTGAAAGLATFTSGERLSGATWVDVSGRAMKRAATLNRFSGGYEGVLGTSLDLIVEAARPSDAAECEARMLGEIERLRRIFSTYDPASEISRVMEGASVESAELVELFAAYEKWAGHTGGLLNVNLAGVVGEWRAAARDGRVPHRDALARAAQRARAYNVDALGKGFIVDRAVMIGRRFAPGGLINLGGDIRAWGESAWTVGVADPRNPADNAPPFVRFALREAAVASSGGYARGYLVAGKRFSHLIDPRTGWALEAGGGATVVAQDCVTANALSTAASIGGFEEGARLAESHRAAGYFLTDVTGRVAAGGVLGSAAAAAAPAPSSPSAGESSEQPAQAPVEASWPANFQVTVQVALKKHPAGTKQIFRPYLAVWIQDAKNQILRTVTLWGDDQRWQRKLSAWWNTPRGTTAEPPVTSRATRPAGAYTV